MIICGLSPLGNPPDGFGPLDQGGGLPGVSVYSGLSKREIWTLGVSGSGPPSPVSAESLLCASRRHEPLLPQSQQCLFSGHCPLFSLGPAVLFDCMYLWYAIIRQDSWVFGYQSCVCVFRWTEVSLVVSVVKQTDNWKSILDRSPTFTWRLARWLMAGRCNASSWLPLGVDFLTCFFVHFAATEKIFSVRGFSDNWLTLVGWTCVIGCRSGKDVRRWIVHFSLRLLYMLSDETNSVNIPNELPSRHAYLVIGPCETRTQGTKCVLVLLIASRLRLCP